MSRPVRVLIVEDSQPDTELIVQQLRDGGYEPRFERVQTSAAMKAALQREPWDVIISDYSMPQFDGRDAFALYKEFQLDIPFISVSGTLGEEGAVDLVKAGVHDYVLKANLTRLVFAMERAMRTVQGSQKRKRVDAEAALLAAIVESTDDAIIGMTLDGTVLSWNRAAECIFGYTAGEMIGRSISVLVPPYRPGELEEMLEKTRQGRRLERFETVRIRKDGKPIDVSLTISPIKDAGGRVIGASTIARDITARRREENERLKLIEELTEALAHVKTLSGLLPICATCKKIRNDRGYWQQVEIYIGEHSDADFTHGICPECLKNSYAQIRPGEPGLNE